MANIEKQAMKLMAEEIVDAIKSLVDTNNRGYIKSAFQNYTISDKNISSGMQQYVARAIASSTFNTSQISNWNSALSAAHFDIAQINRFDAEVAEISRAQIGLAEIDTGQIRDLSVTNADITVAGISVANIANANIANADINFAHIKDVTAGTAIFEEGAAGKLFISRLAVTEAQVISLLTGNLLMQKQDGSIYQIYIDDNGEVRATERKINGTDISTGTITGGANGNLDSHTITALNIEGGAITATEINADNIFAINGTVMNLIADRLDVAELFAIEGNIGVVKTSLISNTTLGDDLDIANNSSIVLANGVLELMVDGYPSSEPPTELILTDGMIEAIGDKFSVIADDINISNNSSITSLSTRLSTAEGTITSQASTLNNVTQNILTPSGIWNIVSNDTNFSAVVQKADKIDWLVASGSSASSITMTENAISAISDQIDLSLNTGFNVTVGELQSMPIGGRNLMIGTLSPSVIAAERPHIKGQTTNTSGRGTCTVAEHGIRMTTTTADWAYIYFGSSSNSSTSLQGVTLGETYTFSADCAWKVLSADVSNDDVYVYFVARSRKAGENFTVIDSCVVKELTQEDKGVEDSGRIEFTFTVPSDAIAFYMGFSCNKHVAASYAIGDYVELSNIKFETGTHVTDWTAAPEDTEIVAGTIAESAAAVVDARARESEEVLRGSIEGFSDDVQQLTVRINDTNGLIEGRVKQKDLETYIRYGVTTGGDGTLELGQVDSDYVARVSPEEGFQVIYDGAEISSMKKNTMSAPIVHAGRMIQIGENVIKLSSDGGLLFN